MKGFELSEEGGIEVRGWRWAWGGGRLVVPLQHNRNPSADGLRPGRAYREPFERREGVINPPSSSAQGRGCSFDKGLQGIRMVGT